MKDRDKRKLIGILTLLSSIAVAVGTALTVTFAALGALIVYGRKIFLEWNEKRKAEMKERKEKGEEKGPGLLDKLKSKFKKSKEKDTCENQPVVSSAGLFVNPVQFNSEPTIYTKEEKAFEEPVEPVRPRPFYNEPPVQPAQPVQPVSFKSSDIIITEEPQVATEQSYEMPVQQPKMQVSEPQEEASQYNNRTSSRFKGIKF